MDCPSCRQGVLEEGQLIEGPSCTHCSKCQGVMLSMITYRPWAETSPQKTSYRAVKMETGKTPEPESQPKAILCPICRRIMRKYRFTWDSWRNIDICQSCEVIWLEPGIWEGLLSREIHTQLSEIVTEPWQRKIRKERTEKMLEAEYLKRFGESDYQRLQKLRHWIVNHPKRSEIIDFLTCQDPYQT